MNSRQIVSRRLVPQSYVLKAGLFLPACLFFASPAYAIPSPELVIGSLSSVSQLLAIGSAMLGGGAAAIGIRAGANNARYGKRIFRLAMALLLVSLTSIGINIYQYSTSNNAELARLQATLTRPARAKGAKILDKNLKVTSFDKQASHPLGISTNDAAKLLKQSQNGTRSDVLFIDVRESGENEMGTLPGTKHIRFPDIATSGIDFTGKKAILMCHNGNRSSETCEKLAKIGIDCRFIKGGIEKWIVEGRPFTDKNVRSLSDLRAIPDYPGKDILLTTDKVHDLIKDENVQFIDVRYPGEFQNKHLPGAVNIPLRATPTFELNTLIKGLPKKPIVAACYDRRGCFISQVLGLELSRAGYDFRGRYTLPWEYFEAPAPKPHIAAWLAGQQAGIWQKGVNALAAVLGRIADQSNIIIAILALAAFSRILVLPISIKAERDQMVITETKEELDALKSRLEFDPKRKARAIQEFYKTHGLTPLRNMLALAFLPVMMLGLASVQLLASNNPQAFLWVADLSKPDPVFLFPAIFAMLGCAYIQIAVAKTPRQTLIGWVIGLPLFVGLAAILSAAGSLYLSVSIALLLLQRAALGGNFSALKNMGGNITSALDKWRMRDGIIPLSRHELLNECGNKSYRLSRLMDDGISVPDGVVLNQIFLKSFLRSPAATRKRLLNRIWKSVAANEVAVRSSAGAEDGDHQSFAGVFESHLNITRDTLEDAILSVANSFGSSRASAYGSNDNLSADGNILVQKMIDAEYAGVLFTRDPEAAGQMMLEMVEGTADELVSGTVAPELFRFGRFSHQIAGELAAPIDLSPLLKIGARAEALFGAPQDIEWTYINGQFIIVQSRDITTLGGGSDKEQLRQNEWENLIARAKDAEVDEVLFRQDEMSEVLPRPTPISLDLMQTLWASGGSVDHACRQLGLSYDIGENAPSRLVTIFGRLYTDARLAAHHRVEITRGTANRLAKDKGKIADNYSKNILPEFNDEISLLESANFDLLTEADLMRLFARQWQNFIQITHVEVEVINIAASFFVEKATSELKNAGIDAAGHLAITSEAGPAKALAEALKLKKSDQKKHLITQLGHRAPFDYELSEPRFQEQPGRLSDMLKMGTSNTPQGIGKNSELPDALKKPVEQAKLYQTLKEDAKHQSLRHLAIIRNLLTAIDRRYNMAGLCFYLEFDEIISLESVELSALLETASSRKNTIDELLKMPPPPSSMDICALEIATSAKSMANSGGNLANGPLSGTRVAGSDIAEGNAFVASIEQAELGADLTSFEDGDILVCSMVHPNWLPYILRAGGVVCDVGGWLSHIAIVAREHNIPMIVGVTAYASIKNGDLLTLDQDGNISRAEEGSLVLIAGAAE